MLSWSPAGCGWEGKALDERGHSWDMPILGLPQCLGEMPGLSQITLLTLHLFHAHLMTIEEVGFPGTVPPRKRGSVGFGFLRRAPQPP